MTTVPDTPTRDGHPHLTISVVVPSYRRPDSLARCLRGLAVQTSPPLEILIVCRADDRETIALVQRESFAEVVTVQEAGLVAALQAGFLASKGRVVAFTDDDAVPRPDWLARLLSRYDREDVGLVGGRDMLHPPRSEALIEEVGIVTRWGRLVGNHHRGTGRVRNVDVLKGVNLSARREAFVLPSGLRGRGTQPHSELALCTWARLRNWQIRYDPEIVVDHFPEARPLGDGRERGRWREQFDSSYNLVAAMLWGNRRLWWRRACYGLMIGDGKAPGMLRGLVALVRREQTVARQVFPSLLGQCSALASAFLGRGLIPALDRTTGRRRVAIVAHDVHEGGGMERAFSELIRRAADTIDFVVVSRTLSADLRPLVVWHRVPGVDRPFPIKFLSFWLLGGLVVRRLHVDVRHSCGALVPNRVDVASVHFCHASFRAMVGRLAPVELPWARRVNTGFSRILALAAENWTYRPGRVRCLAAVSQGLACETSREFPGVDVCVTPNGVDPLDRATDEDERSLFRANHGVGPDDVVLLFVGGNWGHKGLQIVLDALDLSKSRIGGALLLWVVGAGDLTVLRPGKRVSARTDVRFFGSQRDVGPFYRSADIFVLPSLYETFSIVGHEAAAAGLPIVCTPVHGLGDLVGDNEGGIIVERTAVAVAAAVVTLASDAEKRRSLGRQVRERSLPWTWQRSVESVLDCYSAVDQARAAGHASRS